MKIGIFDADHLTPAVIRRYGCYADKFVALLSPLPDMLKQPVLFNRYDAVKMQYPQSLDENDLYIITGSQYSVYENKSWITKLEETVRQINQKKIKLLGICFGHQLIAQSLGGKVEKNSKGWELGVVATHINCHFEWMQPEREFFFALVSHQDQVSQLPDNAINFATTELCAFSGFTIDQHILTLQSHPEFTKEYVKLIIRLQSNNLTPEQRKMAKTSLIQSIDKKLILHWIANFTQY